MRKALKVGFGAILALVLLIAVAFFVLFKRQGVPDGFWANYKAAKVQFDDHGIPTIDADSWSVVIETQGYVVAASRLWQMDLIRRRASGRLSEWFGPEAFARDERMMREGRPDIVRAAVEALPSQERAMCDGFAKGVNSFIREQPWRWGVEYVILRVQPEPWTCADSMLVLLTMAETLSSGADREAQQEVWRRHLSPAWQEFLFPVDHPWNHPLVGTTTRQQPAFPPESQFLPMQPLSGDELGAVAHPYVVGSNNWAWRGPTGTFLSSDPHLGQTVPQLWYAIRLRTSPTSWTVGGALPGLPGVIIGMNSSVAWSFTNSGEDVDDYLQETLSPDGQSYLARGHGATVEWRPIEKRTYLVSVRGESQPREVHAMFTQRGPLLENSLLGPGLYARQWLPLKPGMLRLPIVAMMEAKSMSELDTALDAMTTPSQNAVVADRNGGIGYRVTGVGVRRTVSGRRPISALAGEWAGYDEQAKRPRLFYPAEDGGVRHLATANERVFTDPYGFDWASDDRKDRIETVLSASDSLQREDMERLQIDTVGRFRRLLLEWVRAKAGETDGPAAALMAEWAGWNGDSRVIPRAFTQSTFVETRLIALLIGRVSASFKETAKRVPYSSHMDRAWLLTVLEAPGDDGLRPFGLTATEVARDLVKDLVSRDASLVMHQEANRFAGRHPFVGRLPLIDALFKVGTPIQWGASDLVLAERPEFGPSMRLNFDLTHPGQSTWVFPVGQSGHAGSSHYADLQPVWAEGHVVAMFPDAQGWNF